MRSSESVAANIAEGFESQYPREYMRSLYVARREAGETKVHLRYARDAELAAVDDCEGMCREYDRVGQMLWGLFVLWVGVCGSPGAPKATIATNEYATDVAARLRETRLGGYVASWLRAVRSPRAS